MIGGTPRRNLLIGLSLAAITAIVYWPVARHDFTNFDDYTFVPENPHVLGGWTLENLRWAFTTFHMSMWHPLTWLSLMVDYRLFGLWAGGYHIVNLLLHITNAVLLFFTLQRMTAATWRSAGVAALFALHPLHVESVAWIAERKDVLSTMFWMLALLFYARYVERPGSWRYGWLCVVFVLGLMSKAMVVTLPFVLLLLDSWPLGRMKQTRASRLFAEKIPLFVLTAGACAIAYWGQHGSGAVVSAAGLPVGARVSNALLSYVGYLTKAVYPAGLAVFYPLRPHLPVGVVVAAGLTLAGITVLVVRSYRDEPWLATGWFWFLGTLVPVIGLVQIGGQAMADRYSYVPLIGFFIVVCWSVPAWNERAVVGLAAIVLIACAVLTRIQIGYWQSDEKLFRHALSVTRDNWLAHNNLGVALRAAGQPEVEITEYRQALQLRPDYADAHYNLGVALWEAGYTTEAVAHWEQALRITPGYADAHCNLGVVLAGQERYEEAAGHYEQALEIEPDFTKAHENLGAVLLRLGRAEEAIAHYRRASRLNPNSAATWNNLGVALWQTGQMQEATKSYEEALRIQPDYVEAHYNLGGALEQQGRIREASAQYKEALRLRPDSVEAQKRLMQLEGRP